MTQRGPSALSSLPNLQNLIKRDPASYTDEFLIQFGHYNALRNIIEQGISTSASGVGLNGATAGSATGTSGSGAQGKAGADEERFRELVGFVAQVRVARLIACAVWMRLSMRARADTVCPSSMSVCP